MNIKQTTRWFLDAALFLGFFFTFLLDLTGLEVHQWLGVSAGALAAYHLATHWTWVTAVTRRFFAGTPGRSRLYYVLDALIMGGFVTIAVTGLVISSWLNLKLGSYDGWLTVHIWASVAALAALVAKIGLHWRWVVSVGSAAAAELTAALGSPAPAMKPLPVTAAVAPAPVRGHGHARGPARVLPHDGRGGRNLTGGHEPGGGQPVAAGQRGGQRR